ncbi:hypothetical protein, partial [Paenibacillus contaminans]|uniref:hypothetical protein n=1 Tax=Paenibacillus contaminans TaxID=450362 RepID=UPI001EDD089B
YTEGARTIQSRNLSTYRNAISEENEMSSVVLLTVRLNTGKKVKNSEAALIKSEVILTILNWRKVELKIAGVIERPMAEGTK